MTEVLGQYDLLELVDVLDYELCATGRPEDDLVELGVLHEQRTYVKDLIGLGDEASNIVWTLWFFVLKRFHVIRLYKSSTEHINSLEWNILERLLLASKGSWAGHEDGGVCNWVMIGCFGFVVGDNVGCLFEVGERSTNALIKYTLRD